MQKMKYCSVRRVQKNSTTKTRKAKRNGLNNIKT